MSISSLSILSSLLTTMACLLIVAIMRYTPQDITFTNGVSVSAGTVVTGNMSSTYSDEALFPDAASFDPLRFANMRADGERSRRHYVSTSPADIGFGHGRHAWCVIRVHCTSKEGAE